jgi:predicted transcriptional regulator YheO
MMSQEEHLQAQSTHEISMVTLHDLKRNELTVQYFANDSSTERTITSIIYSFSAVYKRKRTY